MYTHVHDTQFNHTHRYFYAYIYVHCLACLLRMLLLLQVYSPHCLTLIFFLVIHEGHSMPDSTARTVDMSTFYPPTFCKHGRVANTLKNSLNLWPHRILPSPRNSSERFELNWYSTVWMLICWLDFEAT